MKDDPIERAARIAIEKHQRLLHTKVLELVLGDMIAMDGVRAVRERIRWYYDHLAEFEKGNDKQGI